ncbi:MAG: class I SAM-dependent methyltransferase, partial [Candidatus Hydrothermarchaeaceae archaeon]
DLSPELIKTQRKLHEEAGVQAQHIHGDAERLAVSDVSVDIIISNEVIADFSTPEFGLKDVERSIEEFGIPASEELVRSLRDAPDRFRLNLGAFRLLKEVERVLKPGGIAIITEYGYEDQLPSRAQHLDHDEYTIHFGHLVSIARALGLKARLTDAYGFLKFRSNLELITHASYEAAFRLLEHNGMHLPNIVYTRELLREQLGEKADYLRNIRFIRVTDEPMDRAPIEIVKVLICEKPIE